MHSTHKWCSYTHIRIRFPLCYDLRHVLEVREEEVVVGADPAGRNATGRPIQTLKLCKIRMISIPNAAAPCNPFQHGFTGAVAGSSWRLMVFLIYILSSVVILDIIGIHDKAECCSVNKNMELVCWLTLSWPVDSYQLCLKGHETKGK